MIDQSVGLQDAGSSSAFGGMQGVVSAFVCVLYALIDFCAKRMARFLCVLCVFALAGWLVGFSFSLWEHVCIPLQLLHLHIHFCNVYASLYT